MEGISKSDLRLLMFATFRYSLGRRTYMPSFIVDLIIDNFEIFHKEDWKKFIEEINNEKNLGDLWNIRTWNKFVHFCESKFEKLNN